MKITVQNLIALIVAVMTITGGISTALWQVYSYHKTLATNIQLTEVRKEMDKMFLEAKKDSNVLNVTLRLRDVEDSLRFYQSMGLSTLDEFGRGHYEDLQFTLKRLKIERDHIIGLVTK